MMTTHEIAEKVQRKLDQIHIDSIVLKVVENKIQPERDWWYVPVCPSVEPESLRRSIYYDALAEVEGQLMEEDSLNIMFVPVSPEEIA